MDAGLFRLPGGAARDCAAAPRRVCQSFALEAFREGNALSAENSLNNFSVRFAGRGEVKGGVADLGAVDETVAPAQIGQVAGPSADRIGDNTLAQRRVALQPRSRRQVGSCLAHR